MKHQPANPSNAVQARQYILGNSIARQFHINLVIWSADDGTVDKSILVIPMASVSRPECDVLIVRFVNEILIICTFSSSTGKLSHSFKSFFKKYHKFAIYKEYGSYKNESYAEVDTIFRILQARMIKEKSVSVGANSRHEFNPQQRIGISSDRCSKIQRSYQVKASLFDPPALVHESTSSLEMVFSFKRFIGKSILYTSLLKIKHSTPESRPKTWCRSDARVLHVVQQAPCTASAYASVLRRAQGPPRFIRR